MKLTLKHLGTVFALSGVSGLAQGIFVYDQQSSDESLQGESFAVLQTQAPGQSFTPSLASIGFIRFDLFDINNNNGKGAVVYVNVRTNSITGPILATSVPVSLPDGFAVHGGGFTNFYLATPLALTPGTTY